APEDITACNRCAGDQALTRRRRAATAVTDVATSTNVAGSGTGTAAHSNMFAHTIALFVDYDDIKFAVFDQDPSSTSQTTWPMPKVVTARPLLDGADACAPMEVAPLATSAAKDTWNEVTD